MRLGDGFACVLLALAALAAASVSAVSQTRPSPPPTIMPQQAAPRPPPPAIVPRQVAPTPLQRPTPILRIVPPIVDPRPRTTSRPPAATPPREAGSSGAEMGQDGASQRRARPAARPTALPAASSARLPPLPPPRIGSLAAPEPRLSAGFAPVEQEADLVVVVLAPGLDEADGTALADALGLVSDAARRSALLDAVVLRLRIPDGRGVADVLVALSGDARVALAGPSRVYRAQGGATPFALHRLGLAERGADGDVHADGRGVVVAVIDTAPDLGHPMLRAADIRLESVLDAPTPMAEDHGTQMVGLIAGGAPLPGAAPGASIVAIAAFASTRDDAQPRSATFTLVAALDAAAAAGAGIVSMSFAGGEDALVARALSALAERDALLVAAVGNGGPDAPPAHPAAHPDVIGVTATDRRDRAYEQAGRGVHVELAAPGVDLPAPATARRYVIGSGTSLATAYVAAAAALARAAHPISDARTVREALARTSDDLGAPGRDPTFGYGLAAPLGAIVRLEQIEGATATSSR